MNQDDCYWTVTYLAEGRRWWAVGSIMGWTSIDSWTDRARLDEETAREVYRDFRTNPHNERLRLMRVTRRSVPSPSEGQKP